MWTDFAERWVSGFPNQFVGASWRVGFRSAKEIIDRMSGVSGWRYHDLRRTARSLMSRAGVASDIAERVLGHAIPGVAGVYDRHSYVAEKRDALTKLARLVEEITRLERSA